MLGTALDTGKQLSSTPAAKLNESGQNPYLNVSLSK